MNNNHDVSCKKIKEAVCIDTARVYDSCADKDCLADVRVYFTEEVQNIIIYGTKVVNFTTISKFVVNFTTNFNVTN